jgi:hypothetical protein
MRRHRVRLLALGKFPVHGTLSWPRGGKCMGKEAKSGRTAPIIAVFARRLKAVKLLPASCADFNTAGVTGFTAFKFAET